MPLRMGLAREFGLRIGARPPPLHRGKSCPDRISSLLGLGGMWVWTGVSRLLEERDILAKLLSLRFFSFLEISTFRLRNLLRSNSRDKAGACRRKRAGVQPTSCLAVRAKASFFVVTA